MISNDPISTCLLKDYCWVISTIIHQQTRWSEGEFAVDVSGWSDMWDWHVGERLFRWINFSTTLPTSCNTKSRCSHPKQSAQSLGIDFSIASWRTLLYEAIQSNGVDKKTQDCSTLSLLWQSKPYHTVQTRTNRTNANLHIKSAIRISKRFDTLKHCILPSI